MKFTEIQEACWKGYRQAGMKKKGDRQVPNCVPVEEAVDPFLDNTARELLGLVIMAGGAFAAGAYYTVLNKLKKYQGRQIIDALERKGVRFNRETYERIQPLLDQFKQALRDDEGEQAKMLAKRIEQMIVMGKLSALEPRSPDAALAAKEKELAEDLKKWFKEKWVRFGPDGKIRGDCARGSSSEGKPKCLPQAKAHALGKKGRASAASKKRREDPNPERRGPARNVATKVREQDVAEARPISRPEDAIMALKKFTAYLKKNIDDLASMASFEGTNYDQPYVDERFEGFLSKADGTPITPVFNEGGKLELAGSNKQYLNIPTALYYRYPAFMYGGAIENQLMQILGYKQKGVAEATGDPRFDTMMSRIVDPVAALSQDRVYEEQLEDYVFAFMNQFLDQMDKLGIEVWLDNPRAGEDLTNPKFLQAYEQASVKAVQRFMQRKKLDVNNQRLVAKVKADFDENADQVNPVAGFLGAFMQGFTVLRPGEVDILGKAGMLKKPGEVDEAQTDYQKRRQRERDVDMGKPVRPLPKNPRTDYQKRREQERRDMELGENQLDEKQDACYRKVKSRYKVWPSAYASGALVQCRKKGAANWGNKTKKE